MALTGDEEADDTGENGIHWLLENHRELIDAEYAINTDGGNLQTKKGTKLLNELQYAEKGYLSFALEVKNKGGHSSLPEKENAIYRLSRGLVRLSEFEFPVTLDAGTRAFFEAVSVRQNAETSRAINRMLSTNPPDAAARALLSTPPDWNAKLRTTCVATMLEAGHAENALPQSAKATVNCRILPSQDPASMEQTLRRGLGADPTSQNPLQPLPQTHR